MSDASACTCRVVHGQARCRRPDSCARLAGREHFMGQPVFNACYAHAWDPTCTKLLCVGGPLAYGLRGSYMALWE